MTFKSTALRYLTGTFLLDTVAVVIPLSAFYYYPLINFITMLRFWHFDTLLKPISDCMRAACLRGFTEYRIRNIDRFMKLFLFMIPLSHLCACLWIYAGYLDSMKEEADRKSWLIKPNDNEFLIKKDWEIYIFSFYWIWEIFSTVGYGDFVGGTKTELQFSMIFELLGLLFFSLLMGLIETFMAQMKLNFDAQF